MKRGGGWWGRGREEEREEGEQGEDAAEPSSTSGGCPALPKTALPREAPGEGLGAFHVRPPAGEIRDGVHRNGGGE